VGKVLVVLIVLIVAAVVFVWLRTSATPAIPLATTSSEVATDSTHPAETQGNPGAARGARAAPASAVATSDTKNAIDLQINSESDLLAAMSSLGIDDLDERMTRWAVSRGYPEFDQSGNYLLDQPYQQYDEATLRGLADADDMWAQQILAQQIAADRPQEAIEWYKRAAANGSIYAMQEVARLYHRMSNQLQAQDDEVEAAQDSAAKDKTPSEVTAYAWLAAAERSGWDATRGASLIPLIGRKLSQEQVTQACDMAEKLRAQMGAERSSRGLQPFDRTPPPIVYSGEQMGASTQCHVDESTAFDLSGCNQADVHTGATSMRVWVCNPQG
jgi:hypothetical protein